MPVTDTDIQALKDLINQGFEKIDEQLKNLELGQARMEEKLNAVEKRLELQETRIGDQDKRFWTLIVGAFLALFGLLAKVAFFPKV